MLPASSESKGGASSWGWFWRKHGGDNPRGSCGAAPPGTGEVSPTTGIDSGWQDGEVRERTSGCKHPERPRKPGSLWRAAPGHLSSSIWSTSPVERPGATGSSGWWPHGPGHHGALQVLPRSFPPPLPKQGWKVLRVEVSLLGLLWLESLKPAAGTFYPLGIGFLGQSPGGDPRNPPAAAG